MPTGKPRATTRTPRSVPLSDRVRECLDQYFDQLEGTEPSDLYQMVIAQTERPLFERVMRHTGGNQTRAASLLGISRATLRKKLALYNID
ncbi:MAG: Fis family transcriptional regulator [Gammaproteobacteria bacterium]|nr:MAG: Fis family transcriptional regulator [Gammaproteobacteria bacterium]